MTEKSALSKDTVAYKALELFLKQEIQFFHTEGGEGKFILPMKTRYHWILKSFPVSS